MDDVQTTINTINGIMPADLWRLAVILFLLCGAGLTILSFAEKLSNLRTRRARAAETHETSVMDMLANDKRRLDAHETAIAEIRGKQKSLEDGQRAVCAGVMALLEHELHNGNASQMEAASAGINQYLLNK